MNVTAEGDKGGSVERKKELDVDKAADKCDLPCPESITGGREVLRRMGEGRVSRAIWRGIGGLA
jgi:hypothetical protein